MTETDFNSLFPSLITQDVGFHYAGQKSLLANVNLTVDPGRLTMLIGPNGAGKSTLMKILAGLLLPNQGQIFLKLAPDGGFQNLGTLSSLARSKMVAYLPQGILPPDSYTVQEVVFLGRFPHQRWWSLPGELDRQIVDRTLKEMCVEHLRRRLYKTLSGGEQQSVLLAGILAQESSLLLLDEPGKALDIHHLGTLSSHLRRLTREGKGILCITHDLNLASRFADTVYLLSAGEILAQGTPAQVLTQNLLSKAYGNSIDVTVDKRSGLPVVLPRPETQEAGL